MLLLCTRWSEQRPPTAFGGVLSRRPLAIGKTVKEQFQNDLNLELQAIPRLNKAIATATAVADNGSRELFEKILVDEEHHVDWLEAQLHMMSEVGEGNYLAQQIHKDE